MQPELNYRRLTGKTKRVALNLQQTKKRRLVHRVAVLFSLSHGNALKGSEGARQSY